MLTLTPANVPNKQRKVASRRKVQSKKASQGVTKNPRGTAKSTVLHPTSGPLAPPSGKKARKLEKAQNHARRRQIERAMAEEGEVEMTGEYMMYCLMQREAMISRSLGAWEGGYSLEQC